MAITFQAIACTGHHVLRYHIGASCHLPVPERTVMQATTLVRTQPSWVRIRTFPDSGTSGSARRNFRLRLRRADDAGGSRIRGRRPVFSEFLQPTSARSVMWEELVCCFSVIAQVFKPMPEFRQRKFRVASVLEPVQRR